MDHIILKAALKAVIGEILRSAVLTTVIVASLSNIIHVVLTAVKLKMTQEFLKTFFLVVVTILVLLISLAVLVHIRK